jgi:hypothetical protein
VDTDGTGRVGAGGALKLERERVVDIARALVVDREDAEVRAVNAARRAGRAGASTGRSA